MYFEGVISMNTLRSILFKNIRITKTLRKWMMSYISVLVIPLLTCSIYYTHVYKIIRHDATVRQHLALENVRSQIDGNINEMISMSTKLQMNDLVTSIAYKSENSPELPIQLRHLVDELSIYMVTNNLLQEIYIYFPNNDYIVSSSTVYQNRYTQFMPSRYIQSDSWDKLLSSSIRGKHVLRMIDRDSKLIYSKPILMENRSDEPLAMIVIEINTGRFVEMLKRSLNSSDFSSLSLVENDRIILSTDPGLIKQALTSNDFATLFKITVGESNNVEYKLDSIEINTQLIRLMSLTEINLYNNELTNMLIILFISLIASILLGTIMTFYFSLNNYRPLQDIMGFLKASSDNTGDRNEFKTIKNAIMQSTLEINTQRAQLKNSYLYKLLTGEVLASQVTDSVREQLQLPLSDDHVHVVLLHSDQDTKMEFNFFITQNILEEMFHNVFCRLNFCYAQNEIAMIAETESNISSMTKQLFEGIDAFITYCSKHFDIHFLASLSELCMVSNLPDAYKQANNTMEYMKLFKTGHILSYSETPQDSKICYLDLRSAEYLTNLVTTCNRQTLSEYFHTIRLALSTTYLSTEDAKSCLYFFYNVTMRLKTQLDHMLPYRTLSEIWSMDNRFLNQSLSDALREIENLYMTSIELLSNQGRSSDKKVLDVIQFIENNYFDMDLNLNNIADKFNISPAYLSKKFKDDTGEKIIDFLYKIRIDKSLSLIEDTKLKISDIAEMVGFTNSNAYIRIFKKFKGCTPGQLKQ